MLSIPFYVTRKNAQGEMGTWSINGYVGLAVLVLLWLNLLAWGVIGLVEAGRYFL